MYNLELRPLRRHFWNTDFDKFFDTSAKTDELYAPACEILDGEKSFTISLDIPGVKKDDINLEVKDNHLYLSGERKTYDKVEKETVLRTERRYGKFSRVFTLPQNVNADAIKATFENGVLELVLPKEEKAVTRKIAISDWKESDLKN